MEWVERSVRFNNLTLTVRARYRRLPFFGEPSHCTEVKVELVRDGAERPIVRVAPFRYPKAPLNAEEEAERAVHRFLRWLGFALADDTPQLIAELNAEYAFLPTSERSLTSLDCVAGLSGIHDVFEPFFYAFVFLLMAIQAWRNELGTEMEMSALRAQLGERLLQFAEQDADFVDLTPKEVSADGVSVR
jgi:hypothetical protein